MTISDRFDLDKQFTFYASYHDNTINKIIHFLCIWPILWSATILLAGTNDIYPRPGFLKEVPFHQYMGFNFSLLVPFVYVPWYLLLDKRAGLLASLMVLGVYLSSNYLVQHSRVLTGLPSWKWALPVHVFCWIAQFIGHGVFERRAPALLDSLDQAIITAPLFVVLEILIPFGYQKERFDRVMKQVKINVKQFHASKNKRKAK